MKPLALIPAITALSACFHPLPDCDPVPMPDTPRLHVVAAPSPEPSPEPTASPSPSPNEGDNAELFRPAHCVEAS
jgi:hypothetical protein